MGDADSMLDACRFMAAVAKDADKRIMVVDCSTRNELFATVLGDTDCSYYIYRGITYTNDIKEAGKESVNYDIILLYMSDIHNMGIVSNADSVIFCYDNSRVSYDRLCKILCGARQIRDIFKKCKNNLLYRGDEKDSTVERIRHLIEGDLPTYYVPKCTDDMRVLNKMDYGYFDKAMLSVPMLDFLVKIIDVDAKCYQTAMV